MKKANRFFTLLISVVFLCAVCVGCKTNDISQKEKLSRFSEWLESGDFSGVRMTIYYITPDIFTRAPLSVDDLVNFYDVNKIVVSEDKLQQYIDLFKLLNIDDISFVKNSSNQNIRLYYVLESEKYGKMLDVAMWSEEGIILNGTEIEDNKVFYDIITPFLPKDIVEKFKFE